MLDILQHASKLGINHANNAKENSKTHTAYLRPTKKKIKNTKIQCIIRYPYLNNLEIILISENRNKIISSGYEVQDIKKLTQKL